MAPSDSRSEVRAWHGIPRLEAGREAPGLTRDDRPDPMGPLIDDLVAAQHALDAARAGVPDAHWERPAPAEGGVLRDGARSARCIVVSMPDAALTRALPAYLGGKRRLAPLIFAELAGVLPRPAWSESVFLDPMCGGGAVALQAKAQGFAVVAGDAAERGVVVACALIANSRVRLRRLDLLSALALPAPPDSGRARMDIFTPEQERVLHAVLDAADRSSDPLGSLLRLLAIKAALRAFPLSLPNATDAAAAAAGNFERVSSRRLRHYVRARSRFGYAGLWRLAEEINAGVFGGTGHAFRGDARDAIRTTAADVLYLDPPYPGTTGYGGTPAPSLFDWAGVAVEAGSGGARPWRSPCGRARPGQETASNSAARRMRPRGAGMVS